MDFSLKHEGLVVFEVHPQLLGWIPWILAVTTKPEAVCELEVVLLHGVFLLSEMGQVLVEGGQHE